MADFDTLWQQASDAGHTAQQPQSFDNLWDSGQPKPPPTSGNAVADSLFGGAVADNIFNSGHLKHIAEAFGQGFTQAHGDTGIDPELQKTLQNWGVFDKYKDGKTDILKQANEVFLRPAIAVGTTAWAALAGGTAAIDQLGHELSATGSEIQEKAPGVAGQVAGWMVGAPGEMLSGTTEGWLPEGLLHARANGAIGESEGSYFGTKKPTPEQEAGRNAAASQRPPQPPNVHTVARSLAPSTFDQYDALAAQREQLRRELNTGDPNHPRYLAKQDQIKAELDRVEGDETKLGKNKARYVAQLRAQLEDLPKYEETPERAALRQKIQDTDVKMRDLAPDVSTAYRMAGEQLGARTEPVQGETASEATEVAPKSTAIQDAEFKKLKEAGQSDELARANAGMVQALYETHAARWGGKLGTAEEIYNGQSPEVRRGEAGPEGENVLNQYAGVRSEATPKDKFNAAVQMEQSGQDPEKIRLATGWFRNPLDKKWRFEYSDHASDLMPAWQQLPETKLFEGPSSDTTLGQILHHPELFKHYPDAADITVRKQRPLFDLWQSTQGFFIKEANMINVTPYAQNPHSVLLHEIQHWIQTKEGFAKGGNTSTVIENLSPERLKIVFQETIQRLQKESDTVVKTIDLVKRFAQSNYFDRLRSAWSEAEVLWQEFKHYDYPKIPGDLKDAHDAARSAWHEKYKVLQGLEAEVRSKLFDHEGALTREELDSWSAITSLYGRKDVFPVDNLLSTLKDGFVKLNDNIAKLQNGDTDALKKGLSEDRAHQLYRAIAGEIEARDVQERQGLTEEGRKAFEPMKSQTYDPDDVTVTYNQEARGSLQIVKDARNIIRLFKKADASTFMHETAHDWLNRLDQDSNRHDAPTDVVLDMAIINRYLKRAEGQPLTRAMHEKFARSWEQYLREGRAPTPELASIFAKFKEWLTKIYNTAGKLKAPINDDIRDVFARMLSTDPNYEGVTIAPETEATSTAESEVHGGTVKSADGTESVVPKPAVDDSANQIKPEGLPSTPNSVVTYNQSDYIDKDGNVKWENITDDASVQAAMRAWSDRNNDFVKTRRLGLTDTDRIEGAEIFGMTGRNMKRNLDKLQKLTADNPIPLAVRFEALKNMLVQNTQRIMDAAKNDNPVAFADTSLTQLNLMRTFLAMRTAWGQMGHVMQKAEIETAPAEALDALLQKSLGRGQDLDTVRQSMAMVRKLDTPAKISKFTKDMLNPSLGEMITEYFKNNLISGPLTHLQYTLGNKVLGLMQAGPETWAAALAGDFRESKLGHKLGFESDQRTVQRPDGTYHVVGYDRVQHGEAQAGVYAYIFGQRDGLKAMWDAAKAGQTVTLPGEDLANTPFTQTKSIPNQMTVFGKEIPLHTPEFKVGKYTIPEVGLGDAVRAPGERMVAAIHSADRTVNFLAAKAMFSYRAAIEAGLEPGTPEFATRLAEIQNNPSEELMTRARDYATEAALMGKAGTLTRLALNVANWQPQLPRTLLGEFYGRVKPFGFISPFITINGNIMRKTFMERTPLGFLTADALGKNGTLAQDIAIGRAAVGTAVFGAMAGLYTQGLIQPAAPSDYKEAAVRLMAYGLPYSLRVGDMTYAFDRLGVYGSHLALGADIMHAIQKGHEQPDIVSGVEEAGVQLMYSILHHVMSEGFLSGVSGTMKAVDEHEHYGASWVKNFFTSGFLPYGIGQTQLAQQIDPYVRKSNTIMEGFKARVPFLSEELEAKIDMYGNPVPNKEFWGVYAKQVHDDPITQSIISSGFFPAPVKKDIMGVPLTEQQYTDYAHYAGTQFRALLEHELSVPNFDKWPVELRHSTIMGARTQANSLAQGQVMAKYRDHPDSIIDKVRANKQLLSHDLEKAMNDNQ